MSLFRPSTMDSWNVFSRKFWTFANLFGKTNLEKEKEMQKMRLDEAHEAIENFDLSNDPDCLYDVITADLIQEPVITKYGTVFDKASLENCLRRNPIDPTNRQPLTMNDAKPFPELKECINKFKRKKEVIESEVAARIARETAELSRRTKELEQTLEQIKFAKKADGAAKNFTIAPQVKTNTCINTPTQSWSGFFKQRAESTCKAIAYCNPFSLFGKMQHNTTQTVNNNAVAQAAWQL